MHNPFLRSAAPRFVDRDEIIALARETAQRIVLRHPGVTKVILFGSFARGDYGCRSDLDLLVVLEDSDRSARERIEDFLRDGGTYPIDIFPYTRKELESRIAERDPFILQALREGIPLYPE